MTLNFYLKKKLFISSGLWWLTLCNCFKENEMYMYMIIEKKKVFHAGSTGDEQKGV